MAADVPELACGDELRVRQILLNLMFNGVKFTPAGQVKIECSIKERLPNGIIVRFLVSDTGIGITDKQKKLSISPLFKQKTRRRAFLAEPDWDSAFARIWFFS